MNQQELYITEIFYSIQGESFDAGYPCVFVRLSGCDLRCIWCDTEYSFKRGQRMSFAEILDQVESYGVHRVEITGGEPLLQKNSISFMEILLEKGFRVLLETGGHRSLSEVPKDVIKIMDLKCPGSGMEKKNLYSNLQFLIPHQDQVKFVLANRNDYEFAKKKIQKHSIPLDMVLLSPVWESLPPRDLAKWVLEDRLEVKIQLQLHKILSLP
ncbi:MAG: radical SAM protein [Planctomycetota bacterium]|nr:MAG: radical SAM protein [Planctomycetota bacterium]